MGTRNRKILFCLIGILFFSGKVFSGESIKIAFKNFPPYTGSKLNRWGPLTQKIKEVLAKNGYEVTFYNLSEERAVVELERMHVDAIFPFNQNFTLNQKFVHSNTMVQSPFFLYYYRPNTPINDFTSYEALFKNNIVVTHNTVDLATFFSKIPIKKGNLVKKSTTSFRVPCVHLKDLKSKKVQYLALSQIAAKYWIQHCPLREAKNLFHLNSPIAAGKFSMYFNRSNPKTERILEIINQEFIHPLEVF